MDDDAFPLGSPTTALDYAPRVSKTRRRILRISSFTSLIIAALAIYQFRAQLLDWSQRLRLRNSAMMHQSPIDVPIMTQFAKDTEKTWSANYQSRVAGADAVWLRAESQLIGNRLTVSPGSDVTVFLHERTTRSGATRLVSVNLSPGWNPHSTCPRIDVRLFDVGTFFHPELMERTMKETPANNVTGRLPGFGGLFPRFLEPIWGSDFRLFPGRPDPQHPSRFLIDFVINGKRDTIVCDLADDDSISFSLQSGNPYPPRFPTTSQMN
jgi:hypothetical protein